MFHENDNCYILFEVCCAALMNLNYCCHLFNRIRFLKTCEFKQAMCKAVADSASEGYGAEQVYARKRLRFVLFAKLFVLKLIVLNRFRPGTAVSVFWLISSSLFSIGIWWYHERENWTNSCEQENSIFQWSYPQKMFNYVCFTFLLLPCRTSSYL